MVVKLVKKLLEKSGNLSKYTKEFQTNTIESLYYLRPSSIMIRSEGQNRKSTLKITRGADNE